MKLSKIISSSFIQFSYGFTLWDDYNNIEPTKDSSQNRWTPSERKLAFTELVWDPKNFQTFIFDQELTFNPSFMNLSDKDLKKLTLKYWQYVMDNYAFGGIRGFDRLLSLSDKAFNREVQLGLNFLGVTHDKIDSKGRQSVIDFMDTIPYQGQSTRILSKYLVSSYGRNIDTTFNRTLSYISTLLTRREYYYLMELFNWSQLEFEFLPDYLYDRAMIKIRANLPEETKESSSVMSKKGELKRLT